MFFSNDRNGIYGLGYPALTLFDRLVHLAELTTLAGAVFVLVLLGTAFFTRVARERPHPSRERVAELASGARVRHGEPAREQPRRERVRKRGLAAAVDALEVDEHAASYPTAARASPTPWTHRMACANLL